MAQEQPRSSTQTKMEEPMSQQLFFKGVYPIGDTDTQALPVKELGPAIGYYTQVLGFSLVSKGEKTAVLQRDEATIGIPVNGRDPEQASCVFPPLDVRTPPSGGSSSAAITTSPGSWAMGPPRLSSRPSSRSIREWPGDCSGSTCSSRRSRTFAGGIPVAGSPTTFPGRRCHPSARISPS